MKVLPGYALWGKKHEKNQCSNNCGVPTPPEETCSEICFDRVFECHAFSKHCSVAIRWFVLLSGLVTRTNQ